MDMSPYAAALIRLYTNPKNLKIDVDYKKFPRSKNIHSFYIFASDQKIRYFGNFSHNREYLSQIIFYSKRKIVLLPHQAFALSPQKTLKLLLKKRMNTKNY